MKGVEIRKPEQLENVNSLIIPGGESTTMAKLAEFHNLVLLSLSGSVYMSYGHVKHARVKIFFAVCENTGLKIRISFLVLYSLKKKM